MLLQQLSYWNPWGELDRVHNEVARLIDSRMRGAALPHGLQIWTHDDGAVVAADLPGVDPASLEVSVLGEVLTLGGRRPPAPEGSKALRRERPEGDFQRTVTLPFRVDADAIEARYIHGVLHVKLPRSAADKPRRIAVAAA